MCVCVPCVHACRESVLCTSNNQRPPTNSSCSTDFFDIQGRNKGKRQTAPPTRDVWRRSVGEGEGFWHEVGRWVGQLPLVRGVVVLVMVVLLRLMIQLHGRAPRWCAVRVLLAVKCGFCD